MSNIKTLKSFKKGKDPRRNLKGRPVGSVSITKKIREELAKIPKGNKKTQLELLVEQVLKKAIKKGDIQMLKMIWNYIDGLPMGSLDITSGGKRISIKFDEAFNKDTNQKNKKK